MADIDADFTDDLTVSDDIDAINFAPKVSDALTVSDATDANREMPFQVSEAFTVADAVDSINLAGKQTEAVAVTDLVDASVQNSIRRKKSPVLATGRHLSVKLRSNAAGNRIYLETMGAFISKYSGRSHATASQVFGKGNHLSVTFRNATLGETITMTNAEAFVTRLPG